MLLPHPSPREPSASEISHLINGTPSWYPHGCATHGEWQIPVVQAPVFDAPAVTSIAYDKRGQSDRPGETVLHGYVADRKLRPHVAHPGPWVARFSPFWGIIAPDFSVRLGDPPDRRVFAVRMSRAIAAFYASRGLRVIPSIRWGDHRDYEYCFLGVEPGSAVAVSNHGLWKDQTLRQMFVGGIQVLREVVNPRLIFVHGTIDHPVLRNLCKTTEVIHLEADRTRVRKRAS